MISKCVLDFYHTDFLKYWQRDENMIVGITGTSGSGKSTVSAVFERYGFTHINLDAVSKDLATPDSQCLKEIISQFGDDLLLPDGSLDRHALGEIVFRDKQKLDLLNTITHKYILKEMDNIIARTEGDILIDAPLLFESGADSRCDFTVCVTSDRKMQIKRIAVRDGISEETAAARLDRQHSNEFFTQKSDYCIENKGSLDELEQKSETLIRTLRERAENA